MPTQSNSHSFSRLGANPGTAQEMTEVSNNDKYEEITYEGREIYGLIKHPNVKVPLHALSMKC